MFFINNNNITDPRINLALEEYCLRNLDTQYAYLLFYVNEPSIIIGRNQNTFEEINYEYVKKKGIHVIRRISGGGAVYHDHGNLNFSFITRYEKNRILNFKKFTKPVIDALHQMAIPARLNGRNDIVIETKKISGNAQYATPKSILSHGTLLFDSNIEILINALNVRKDKIRSKGLKSVRSRVVNISEYLNSPMDMDTFKMNLLNAIYEPYRGLQEYKLTDKDWETVYRLSEKKYRTWDWNYGRSPVFNIHKAHRFDMGQIDIRMDVKNGVIKAIKIYGDFLGHRDIKELEEKLIDRRYETGEFKSVLKNIDLNHYFGRMTYAEFINFIF